MASPANEPTSEMMKALASSSDTYMVVSNWPFQVVDWAVACLRKRSTPKARSSSDAASAFDP